MCAELYFLINLGMDFAVLAAAARGIGTFRFRRVFAGSGLAAVGAMLPRLRGAPSFQAILFAALVALVSGSASPALLAPAAASLTACALLPGALALRMSPAGGLGFGSAMVALCGLAVASCHARRLQLTALSPPLTLRVVNEGRAVQLRAIIDTGNRLSEPLSGQPVMIAGAGPVARIVPREGLRPIAFSSVGGCGTLRCFRPQAIYLQRGARRRRMPGAWIAVFPGKLPDGAQALAPAAFARCASGSHFT